MAPPDLGMDLLVFRSGATRFGLDAAQIAEVLSVQELEETDGAGGDHCVSRGGVEIPVVELEPLASGGSPANGGSVAGRRDAKVVLPKAAQPMVGFVIGDPEEMTRVEVEQIEPLPPLVRSMVKGSGIWAAAKCEGGLVILIDLVEATAAAVRG